MTRRVLFLSAPSLLVPLLAVVLVGFAKGQGAVEHEGGAGANPQTSKTEVLVLHAHFNKGLWDGDPAEVAPCVADGYTKITERFGIGGMLNKAQRLENLTPRQGSVVQHEEVVQFEHYIHLHVFGDHSDTVVLTGLSKSLLRVEGKLSSGPRLYAFVYVKQHGRWMIVAEMTSDIPKGNAPWNTW